MYVRLSLVHAFPRLDQILNGQGFSAMQGWKPFILKKTYLPWDRGKSGEPKLHMKKWRKYSIGSKSEISSPYISEAITDGAYFEY